MPQTARGYPYPDGTAKVGEFDLHVKALADAIEARLGRVQAGTQSVTIPSGSSSQAVNINFPEGFPTTPAVALSIGASGAAYSVVRGASSTTSVTVTAHRPPGAPTTSAATLAVNWIAKG